MCVSPTNCSSAATGVSRGYGQDPRFCSFFLYFYFYLFLFLCPSRFFFFFFCGCVLLSWRDSQSEAMCWLQAPPPRPPRGRRLWPAPTRFLLCSIGEVERARARSSHRKMKNLPPTPMKKKGEEEEEEEQNPTHRNLLTMSIQRRPSSLSNVGPVFTECGLLLCVLLLMRSELILFWFKIFTPFSRLSAVSVCPLLLFLPNVLFFKHS